MPTRKTTTTIDALVCGTKLGRNWPAFCPTRPSLDEIWQRLTDKHLNSTNTCPKARNIGHHLVDFGQQMTQLGSFVDPKHPSLAMIGPTSAKFGRDLPNFDRHRPNDEKQMWLSATRWSNFDHCWSQFGSFRPTLVDLAPIPSNFGQGCSHKPEIRS